MPELTPWQRVQLARSNERPTALFYIEQLITDFIELHGDRHYSDDASIIGGVGRLDGRPITVIAQEKGRDTQDKVRRNFGSPHPEGYRKSLRLMQQAEKFHRPILCLVDTQGAFCGTEAEQRGQGEAIARNLAVMMNLHVPIVSVVLGEGGSGGALAIACANYVYMLENATYSILSPEGFASILWKDAARASEAADVMKLTARDLLDLKVIEGIIAEPEGGAQNDAQKVVEDIRACCEKAFNEMSKLSPEAVRQQRYERFRDFK